MVAIFQSNSSLGQLVPSGVCSEHSTCVPLSHGKFWCDCHPGWEGERCQTGKLFILSTYVIDFLKKNYI